MAGLALLVMAGAADAKTAPFPAPSLDSIAAAAAADRAARCGTSACEAVEVIDRALSILLQAQATSVGVTKPLSAEQGGGAGRALDRVLLDHPARFAPVCGALSGLARQYPPGDLFVAVGVIELALRIDLRAAGTGQNCLPGVLRAFPLSAQAETARRNARVLCANAWGLGEDCGRLGD